MMLGFKAVTSWKRGTDSTKPKEKEEERSKWRGTLIHYMDQGFKVTRICYQTRQLSIDIELMMKLVV